MDTLYVVSALVGLAIFMQTFIKRTDRGEFSLNRILLMSALVLFGGIGLMLDNVYLALVFTLFFYFLVRVELGHEREEDYQDL